MPLKKSYVFPKREQFFLLTVQYFGEGHSLFPLFYFIFLGKCSEDTEYIFFLKKERLQLES